MTSKRLIGVILNGFYYCFFSEKNNYIGYFSEKYGRYVFLDRLSNNFFQRTSKELNPVAEKKIVLSYNQYGEIAIQVPSLHYTY